MSDLRGMIHGNPLSTEVEAAQAISRHLTELHHKVHDMLSQCPQTDEELERQPCFAAFGPSSVRKRRSELYQAGLIEVCGERSNSRGRRMKVWCVTELPAGLAVRGAGRLPSDEGEQ